MSTATPPSDPHADRGPSAVGALGEDDRRCLLALTPKREPVAAIAARLDHGPGYTLTLAQALARHGLAQISGEPGQRRLAITWRGQQRKDDLLADLFEAMPVPSLSRIEGDLYG